MAGSKKPKLDVAVIAAAGSGTRLLPVTLHQPKAMVAVADRPLIHYVVDQLAAGGITRFVIVIHPKFQTIRAYLAYQRKQKEWKGLHFVIVENRSVDFADSLMAAKKHVGNSDFVAVTCDDILDDTTPPFATFRKLFERYRAPMVLLREIDRKQTPNYGVISGERLAKDVWRVTDVIEKPSPTKAPSNLGAVGNYILPASIFRYIANARKRLKGKKELSVIDALKLYLADGGECIGWVFRGTHFDGGSPSGLLKASLHFGMKHPSLGPAFTKYLRSL